MIQSPCPIFKKLGVNFSQNFTMSELKLFEIVKILLQDFTLLQNWFMFSHALDIPTSNIHTIQIRLGNGSTTMYQVIHEMLEIYKGRTGSQYLKNLIQVLEKEELLNAAELLKRHVEADTSGPIPITILPEANSPFNGIQLLNGHLIIEQRIDAGAFSQVLKARSIVDNKNFAIKRICVGQFLQLTKTSGAADSGEYFEKLMREVVAMSQLSTDNPHIVGYQHAWFEGPLQETFTKWLAQPELMPCPSPVVMNAPTKRPIIPSDSENSTFMFIKMELMDTNLGHWLQFNQDNIGDLETTKNITKQIFTGLASIHGRNFVHRDLHPNNILLNTRGGELIVKIGDFGLSREMPEVDTALTLQVGCRQFASPEMERGDKYDFKTDIFSVGLLVLFMLVPFETKQIMERAFDDVRKGELKILDKLEKSCGQSLSRLRSMLDRNPENRPTATQALG